MRQLSLFDAEPHLPPHAARLAPKLKALTEQGIFLGTSSWKYEGWLGSIYSPERYSVRGKFSSRKFEQECLQEYAQTFPIVGGDFSFYQFPTSDYWERLFDLAPNTFRFAFKVPEEITIATWPNHIRYGKRAGEANEGFLDAHLLEQAFLHPLIPYRMRVAALIFEFGTFSQRQFPKSKDYLDLLGSFLARLPPGFSYAVEIRNPEYLDDSYFETLERHHVAHVFNAWTRMPELSAQIEKPGAFTTDFTVVRALLKKGRSYEQAVKSFEPYKSVQETNPNARRAMQEICIRSRQRRQPAFLLVNNRLEGNAPGTIEAVADGLLS